MFVLGHTARPPPPKGIRRWNPAAGTVLTVASVSRTYGLPGSWYKEVISSKGLEALELPLAEQSSGPTLHEALQRPRVTSITEPAYLSTQSF